MDVYIYILQLVVRVMNLLVVVPQSEHLRISGLGQLADLPTLTHGFVPTLAPDLWVTTGGGVMVIVFVESVCVCVNVNNHCTCLRMFTHICVYIRICIYV